MARGFTLIECLVALAVIIIGFLGALMLQGKAMEGGYQATSQTAATLLAESKIEEVSSLLSTILPADLQNGGPQEEWLDGEGQALPSGSKNAYLRSTVLRFGCPIPPTNEIEVTVSWLDGSKSLTYTSVYMVESQ